jgi:D-arabinose 1-dehydrogenase-like Zn-dependent alcohol dehydrogenase
VATSWHAVRTQANLKPAQTLMVVGLGGWACMLSSAGEPVGARSSRSIRCNLNWIWPKRMEPSTL